MNLQEIKFLVDENIPHAVFEFLKNCEVDVIEVASIPAKGSSLL